MAKSAIKQSNLIEVRKAGNKGRGVFARRDIARGTEIEKAPVIVMPSEDVFGYTRTSHLANYVFNWRKNTFAVALGYGSLYNHSYRPNARYYIEDKDTQVYIAIADIKKGEEITINYNGKPKSKKDVGFDVA